MAKPLIAINKAKALSTALFLVGLAILFFVDSWWPGIMLAVGLPLAILQYLQGRMYDMWVSLFVFVGAFVTVQFNIKWEIFLPVIFAIGGIYIFFREWMESKSSEDEELGDKKKEFEENNDKE